MKLMVDTKRGGQIFYQETAADSVGFSGSPVLIELNSGDRALC